MYTISQSTEFYHSYKTKPIQQIINRLDLDLRNAKNYSGSGDYGSQYFYSYSCLIFILCKLLFYRKAELFNPSTEANTAYILGRVYGLYASTPIDKLSIGIVFNDILGQDFINYHTDLILKNRGK